MKIWHYRTVCFTPSGPGHLGRALNERGLEGWELASASHKNGTYELIFKKSETTRDVDPERYKDLVGE